MFDFDPFDMDMDGDVDVDDMDFLGFDCLMRHVLGRDRHLDEDDRDHARYPATCDAEEHSDRSDDQEVD